MADRRIALMPGDGVGPEVVGAAREVLEAMNLGLELVDVAVGWSYWTSEGNPLPDRSQDMLKNVACALLGPVTARSRDEATKALAPNLRDRDCLYVSPVVQIIQSFDLDLAVRRCKAYPGNPRNLFDGVDAIVIQEITEGFHAGVEFFPIPPRLLDFLKQRHARMQKFETYAAGDLALSTRIVSRAGSNRFLRAAFHHADRHGGTAVCLIDKPSTFHETSRLMLQEAETVAAGYPGIALRTLAVDEACLRILSNPDQFQVVAAPDLFGDIVADLFTQVVGGLTFAARSWQGDRFGLFTPCHGTATRYAGQGRMNPIGTLVAVVTMLHWLGMGQAAARLDEAIARTIAEGKVRTFDMKGSDTTRAMTQTVIDHL